LSDKKTHESRSLADFANSLIEDLEALRAGKITIREAKARTELAREILRAFHLNIQGMRFLSGAAKALPPGAAARRPGKDG
jgi:hypothetical protein